MGGIDGDEVRGDGMRLTAIGAPTAGSLDRAPVKLIIDILKLQFQRSKNDSPGQLGKSSVAR